MVLKSNRKFLDISKRLNSLEHILQYFRYISIQSLLLKDFYKRFTK